MCDQPLCCTPETPQHWDSPSLPQHWGFRGHDEGWGRTVRDSAGARSEKEPRKQGALTLVCVSALPVAAQVADGAALPLLEGQTREADFAPQPGLACGSPSWTLWHMWRNA